MLRDDQLLQAALKRHDISSVRLDWASPDVDWSQFLCPVFRTTWDYFVRRDEFTDWLNRIRSQTQLCNEAALIEWNMDKLYLGDLEGNGISIVPLKFIERGSEISLRELLDECGWDDAILKPCVSDAARHTYRVDRAAATALEPVVRRLLVDESLILQPFSPRRCRRRRPTWVRSRPRSSVRGIPYGPFLADASSTTRVGSGGCSG
ncbi:MAG: hypothetical protein K8U03_20265 [Planctomycetia bacterium]|nr:hypothetical protein [Planctomycetia bacterium]